MKTAAAAASAAVLVTLALAAPAAAITPTITEYSAGLNSGTNPGRLTAGPDDAVWFVDPGATHAIGRITMDGSITEFPVAVPVKGPFDIAEGADGNIWFTDIITPAIWRITPAGDATPLGQGGGMKGPAGPALGPDGNLWFADPAVPALGQVTPGGTVTEYTSGLTTNFPNAMAAGPDGEMWFTDGGNKAVGEIDPTTHTIQEFTDGITGNSAGIVAGADGNMWFLEGSPAKIGRINPTTHAVQEFGDGLNPGSDLSGTPAAGPDGAVWFADGGTTPAVGRVAPDGTITEFGGLPAGSEPNSVTLGPDGNIWFSDEGTHAIGRLTTPPVAATTSASATGDTTATVTGTANGHAQTTTFHIEYGPVGSATTSTTEQTLGASPVSVALVGLRPSTAYQARVVATNPTGTVDGTFLTFTTAALTKGRISALRISPDALVAAARGGSVKAARTTGTLVSYTDSEAATTKFTVQRPASGRRQGRSCRKPSKRNRRHKRCTRYVTLRGSFTHADVQGANSLRFTGRLRGRKLRSGRYRLHAVPRTAAGTGKAANKAFRVKR